MKHEYSLDELRQLKSIYGESGEAALSISEMRALRKAGLLTQDLPPEPSNPDTLADYQALSLHKPEPELEKPAESKPKPAGSPTFGNEHPEVRQRIYNTLAKLSENGVIPTIQQIADELGMSKSGVSHHLVALAKEGHVVKDMNTRRYRPADMQAKETIMTITTKQPEQQEEQSQDPRVIIANALVGIYDSISALQRAAFRANDKVVYGFASKLLTSELMDIKANYSKDAK